MSDNDGLILEMLVRFEERLQRIETAIERLAPEPAISRNDRLLLMQLLPALQVAFGSRSFTAAAVLAEPNLMTACRQMTAKRLGKFFGRTCGVWMNRSCLERRGRQGNVVLWGVSFGVSGFLSGVKAA